MLYQLVAIVGISLGVSFLCSILEAIILSVTHGYVHVLRDRGSKAGAILDRMQKQVNEPIAAILALNTIANTFGAALGGTLAFRIWGDDLDSHFFRGADPCHPPLFRDPAQNSRRHALAQARPARRPMCFVH